MENLVIESLKAYAQLEGINLEGAKERLQSCEQAQEIIFKLACAAAASINA